MKQHELSATGLLVAIQRRPADEVILTTYGIGPAKVTLTVADFLSAARAAESYGRDWGEGSPRVGLFLENHPLTPAVMLGLLAAGCWLVPMNPGAHPSENAHIIASSELDFVVCDDRSSAAARELGSALRLEPIDLIANYPRYANGPTREDSTLPRIVMHTSGTTSKPKGVLLSIESLMRNAWAISKWLGLERSVQLTTLPMYHVHALTFGVLSSLLTGGRLVVLKSFDPVPWGRIVREEQVEWTSVVPSLLPLLQVTGVSQEKCPSLKGVLVSSAPINEPAARRFEERSRIPVIQAWGQTEFTCWATACRSGLFGGEFDDDLRSVGMALPGVAVSVVKTDGTLAAEGEEGELYLQGEFTTQGYLGQPELTREYVTPRGLRTGDTGYYRSIGGAPYYFIRGRLKEVINRSAEKISPASVEAEILSHYPQAAGYVAVVGFPHEWVGEECGLCIDVKLFREASVDEADFLKYLRGMHEAFRPRVAHVSSMPIARTFTGKIQRGRMRDRFAAECCYLGEFKVVDVRASETASIQAQ